MSHQSVDQATAQPTSNNLRTQSDNNQKANSEHLSNSNTFVIQTTTVSSYDPNGRSSELALPNSTLLQSPSLYEESKRDSAVASSPQSGCTKSMDSGITVANSAGTVPKIFIHHQENAEQEKRGLRELQAPMRVPEPRPRPATAVHNSQAQPRREELLMRPSTAGEFRGISTDIPTSSLDGLSSLSKLRFSNRGTLLLDDEEADAVFKSAALPQRPAQGSAQGPAEASSEAPIEISIETPTPKTRRKLSTHRLQQFDGASSRLLSADDAMLSQRVRSMYESGSENAADQFLRPQSAVVRSADALRNDALGQQAGYPSQRPLSRVSAPFPKEEYETAGGIEDWEDLNGEDVDRYGFILPVQEETHDRSKSPRPAMHRIASSLMLASQAPRQKRTVRRSPSKATSSRTTNSKTAIPSASSVISGKTASSRISSQSRYRIATNKLPYNRNRRIVDEAGDMLTLPPGLAGVGEEGENDRIAHKIKSKEWSREEKWRHMAKPIQTGSRGGGMTFDFDTYNPKLISRTWKGVPDKWRAAAWHSFLSASAKRRRIGETDEELVEKYYELQEEDGKDDVQIDTDVPRTISDHVMFRKRYRGG